MDEPILLTERDFHLIKFLVTAELGRQVGKLTFNREAAETLLHMAKLFQAPDAAIMQLIHKVQDREASASETTDGKIDDRLKKQDKPRRLRLVR